MFLTVNNLHEYLIAAELITAASVVDGDYRVAETGRRNRNFKVLRSGSNGLFVKQMKSTEQQATYTIQREAAFYAALDSNPRYAALKRLVPRLVSHDPQRNVLVLENIPQAESLIERQTRLQAYPPDLAASLGKIIGEIHNTCQEMLADPTLNSSLDGTPPWPLNLDSMSGEISRGYGPGGGALMSIVQQQPMLIPLLSSLRPEWQRNCIMHGDLKFDNCIVYSNADGASEIRVVDWELAAAGDAAWDVATIFKDYLVACISSTVMAIHQPGARVWAITELQPSIGAFWHAYRIARGFDANAAAIFLFRTVRLTAARLLTSMLEHLTASPAATQAPTMMAQSAAGILMAPHVAVMQLIGAPA